MTSLYAGSMKVTARLSITPSNSPPSMAPRMLPMPPSTAAVNALSPAEKPMKKSIWV